MVLKRLKLTNFLSHTNSDIVFPEKGIVAFIGENGAGKSSIVKAIEFAIFGNKSQGKSENLANFVQWGKTFAEVELEFKKGNDEYKIKREINLKGNRGRSQSVIFKKVNGEYRVFFEKNVNKEIVNITGLTKKVFSNTTLIKQGEIEGLITLPPAKRAEIFEELLDLKIYQLIVNEVVVLRREYENRIKDLSVDNDIELEKLKLEKINKEEEINNKSLELKRLDEELNKIVNEIKNIDEQLKSLEEEKDRILHKEKDIEKFKERLVQLQNNLKEKEKTLTEVKEAKDKLNLLKPEVDKLNEYLDLKEKYHQVEKIKIELKSLEEKLDNIDKLKQILKDKESLYRRYIEVENSYKDIQEKLRFLSELEGKLASLKNSVDEKNKDLTKLQNSCLKIAKELQKYKQIYKTLELNPLIIDTFIKNNEDDIKSLEEKINNLRSKLKVVEEKGKELRKQVEDIKNLEGKCPKCLRPIDEHSKDEIVKELEEEVKRKREEFKAIKEEIKKYEKDLKVLKEIEEYLKEYKQNFDKYTDIKRDIDKIRTDIFKLQREISKLKDLEEKNKEYEEFLSKNEREYIDYLNALKNLKSYDEDRLKKEFNEKNEKINSLNKELNGISKEEIEAEIKRLEEVKEKYTKLKNLISEEDSIKKEISELKKLIDETDSKVLQLKEEIKDKDKILKKIETLKNNKKKLEEEKEEITKMLYDKDKYIAVLKEQLATLEAKINEIEERLRKVSELKTKVKKAKKIEEALGKDGLQRVLREKLMNDFPKIVNDIFSKFGFPFEQVKLSERFDIYLLAPTKERKDRLVDVGAISGGQRISLGIAVRLALAKFLSSKSSFLILDEPTIHLDDYRRSELVNLLIKLKNDSFINQLIVVSHDTEIEDTADIIYHVRRGAVELV